MRRLQKHWTLFSIIILALAAGWIAMTTIRAQPTTNGQIPSPHEGFLAPDFTLNSVDGQVVQLSQLRGQVVMVNLWATWCLPCQREMPAIEHLRQDYADKGLTILAVNATHQDSPAAVIAFIREHGLTFPVLLDVDGDVSRKYQLQALPTTLFIDRAGIIRKVIIGGPIPEALMQSEVERLTTEQD